MPKEVIARCEFNGKVEQLTVIWTKGDSLDPMIGVGNWIETRNPDGSHADWDPLGPQWALSAEGAEQMIKALNKARRQTYPTRRPAGPGWDIALDNGPGGGIKIILTPNEEGQDVYGFSNMEIHYDAQMAYNLARSILQRVSPSNFGI